ncbi:trichohyalin-like [Parus major]|uniref:trichohyalin-like n=1 Tax=Parus major TaxID=9157 RepID=UPI0014439B6F|nr:trichohyalin-like [Parus major]
MSPFLDSIATIVGVFQQHARGDGDGSGLSRRRMRELIQREFADSLVKPHDPQTIEKILQFLEWDGDGDIDFNEFLLLVFRVAKCCFWFQPRAPFLVQRTKLPSGGKSLREPEFRSRGNHRRLQEEEEDRQTRERNREVELQRDLRLGEVEISEGRRREQQERRGEDAEASGEPGTTIRERFQEEEPADVRTGRQRRETQPRADRWSRPEPGRGERSQRPRGADGAGDNRPREPELLREERSRHHRREQEQRETEGRRCRVAEQEWPESRRPHQSFLEEPRAEEPSRERREAGQEIRLEVLEEEEEEEEQLERGSCRYQTLDVDTGNLCPPGQEAAVSDLRVRYRPADPEVRPEVRLLPEATEPSTIAYLVHVIQNRGEPKAATYEIVCHQPGQPCSVSPSPRPEPQPRATKSQEKPEDVDEPRERSGREVKDGARAEAVKSQEIRRRPEVAEVQQEQPRGEGSQKVPREPRREREDSEARSGAPAPEARECRDPERRDPGESRGEGIQEDEEAPEEESSKRSGRESGNSQVSREGGTKQGQEPSQESKVSRIWIGMGPWEHHPPGRSKDFSIPNPPRLDREFPLIPSSNSRFFPPPQNQKDPGVVDRMMKKLDMNSDGQLDFQEFLNLIGGIAVACHDSLLLKPQNP